MLISKVIKNNINLFSGTIFNILFGIFKLITGFIYHSIWFSATGTYYFILGMMKLSLTRHVIKKSDEKNNIFNIEIQEY